MNLGILVTNYNTAALTKRCISNSLKYAESPIDRFIIIDDCSPEELSLKGNQVEVFRNAVNLGLIRSLNRGLGMFNTDLILILDSDAWPLENYVAKVKAYFTRNPAVGIATFQTINSQGLTSASYEAEPGILSLLLGQQLYRTYLDRISRNPKKINVFTCAMVIRKEVLKEIGSFDENFDWLELDHDLCMRASRKGWEIGVMPIQAFHAGSGTPQQVNHRVIRFYKNRWYLLKKYNKVRLESFTAGFIILRLILEFLLIWTFGFIFFKKLEIVKNKAHSRQKIIKFFLSELWKKHKPVVQIR